MSKKKSKQVEERICCIVYLSTVGDTSSVDKREKKQLSYIQEYADAHNVKIVKKMHRDVMGQADVNHHFDIMVEMIRRGKADGIILANIMSVSSNVADAYYKVGKVKAVGGHIVTVDEGRLGMNVKAVI
jgi:hypothetical protein